MRLGNQHLLVSETDRQVNEFDDFNSDRSADQTDVPTLNGFQLIFTSQSTSTQQAGEEPLQEAASSQIAAMEGQTPYADSTVLTSFGRQMKRLIKSEKMKQPDGTFKSHQRARLSHNMDTLAALNAYLKVFLN